MAVIELGNDRNAESFLRSVGFMSLLDGLADVNRETDTEVVQAMASIAMIDHVLNWSKNGNGGYSMSVVKAKDVRTDNGGSLLRQRGYPQIDFQEGREVNQITIVTGEKTLNEFQFPAHSVVEDSARTIAARLETVDDHYGYPRANLFDSVYITVHRGGHIRFNERPYNAKWTYKEDVSKNLEKTINHEDLYRALAKVS